MTLAKTGASQTSLDVTDVGSAFVVLKNVCGNFTNLVIGAKNGQTSNVIIEGGAWGHRDPGHG